MKRVLKMAGALALIVANFIAPFAKDGPALQFFLASVAAAWVTALLIENRKLEDAKDNAYRERNLVVQALAHITDSMGFRTGLSRDEEEGDEWPVLFIELPIAGQVSWHLPKQGLVRLWREYKVGWDGHTTEEKYQRLRRFVVYWRGKDGS